MNGDRDGENRRLCNKKNDEVQFSDSWQKPAAGTRQRSPSHQVHHCTGHRSFVKPHSSFFFLRRFSFSPQYRATISLSVLYQQRGSRIHSLEKKFFKSLKISHCSRVFFSEERGSRPRDFYLDRFLIGQNLTLTLFVIILRVNEFFFSFLQRTYFIEETKVRDKRAAIRNVNVSNYMQKQVLFNLAKNRTKQH